MDKVVILLATYNGEKYLEEQLESLVNQKDVQVEIIVRDDGSKDGTLEILNKWSKNEKLSWYTGEHLNVQFGFFDLMEKATNTDAEYFAFCDQDDVWDLDKLKIAVDCMQQIKNDCKLYYAGQRLVDGNLGFISNHTLNQNRSIKARFLLSDIAGCTAVFNRELLKRVISYKPTYMLMHDTWILKICLGTGGDIYVDPNPHMSYRQHGSNTVGLGKGIVADLKQVRQYLYEYKVEEQMQELQKGYYNQLIPTYRQIVDDVCAYRNNREAKKRLLDSKEIYFGKKGLDLTYWLKVAVHKL